MMRWDLYQFGLFILLFLNSIRLFMSKGPRHVPSSKSPFYQHIPDCQNDNTNPPVKETSSKGIICTLVRDEEGFLSEFVAYYEMHGFDKIVLYDNNSTQSFVEIEPWIQSGFVSVIKEWWLEVDFQILRPDFFVYSKKIDWLNQLAGMHCQQWAHRMGIDIYVAVDIDEYIIPRYGQNITALDDIVQWMDKTGKHIAYLPKSNFSPTPHFHEPVNLLTIEAYQTRYPVSKKMSYYISTASKIALRLAHPSFTSNTSDALLSCCHFHGCDFSWQDFQIRSKNCSWYQSEYATIWPKVSSTTGKKLPWEEPPNIHHYARSLEKFAMKQDSYDSLSFGNDSLGNGQGLSIYNFLNRAFGFVHDDAALQWSCPLRNWLKLRTGEETYLRPGLHWYRNPEFGKSVEDPRKRGRKGVPLKRPLGWREISPYPPGKVFHPEETLRNQRGKPSKTNRKDYSSLP
jgi:hypothetical protein